LSVAAARAPGDPRASRVRSSRYALPRGEEPARLVAG